MGEKFFNYRGDKGDKLRFLPTIVDHAPIVYNMETASKITEHGRCLINEMLEKLRDDRLTKNPCAEIVLDSVPETKYEQLYF